ncbi:hypothetical protein ARC78_01270 [Stenotrophomonas pictorum JCM 9942]|jgi:hypothetical protein|uniref:DUF3247 domain-containing protein n=1 Tax=Stenotrophomonas pictorum JCM 9942 TaxID=1236960 RepID=A0A0R0ACY1_9GAMM|nr:DUF3247 family protein [Stenotrophomonas pictorum]KRG39383.1 hypothetical protein ARC78_01270 [Stenotrophomonas pictorum JCM 9942]
MSKIAPRVHTDQATIERLKDLQAALDAELVVELHLRGGATLTGTVVERPSILQFLDEGGNEGTNGVLPLDTGGKSVQRVWLDEVEHFQRLGTC